jgi:hypothetical protein
MIFQAGMNELYASIRVPEIFACFPHLQGVHDIFQGSPERMWEPNEPRINKIVFIGKNLNGEELEKGFKDCLLKK